MTRQAGVVVHAESVSLFAAPALDVPCETASILASDWTCRNVGSLPQSFFSLSEVTISHYRNRTIVAGHSASHSPPLRDKVVLSRW